MDFCGTGLAQKTDDPRAGRPADDGIVDHDDTLPGDRFPDHVQFDLDRVFPLPLARFDEAAPDIFILGKLF